MVVKFIISFVLSQSNRASNQQYIEGILIKWRAFIKNNPIRTVLMIKAEEYVRKFFEDYPATPIEAITSDLLELVAKKS